MFNPRNNSPFGGGPFGGRRSNQSAYQYQMLPYGMVSTEAGGLVSKVMALLAASFLVAMIGAFIGVHIGLGMGGYLVIVFGGFFTLLALQAMINSPGINLFLLFLFTFLEGLGLAPLITFSLLSGNGNILAEAFLMTAATSTGLAVYAWTTKRSFTRLGDYLFFGLILLIVAAIVQIFFHSPLFMLLVAFFGVAIFSGYVLYHVQRAKYMADTLPNAILLTVSLFMALLNLFIYIWEILMIVQGGNRGRR